MNDTELRRKIVNHIKRRFAQWRTPPVETPADSWIDDVVVEIIGMVRMDRNDLFTKYRANCRCSRCGSDK